MTHRTPTNVPAESGDGAPALSTGTQADPTPATHPDASAVDSPRDGDRAGAGRPPRKHKAKQATPAMTEEVREVVAENLLATVAADYDRERGLIEIETAAWRYERDVALRGAYFDAVLDGLAEETERLETTLATVRAGAPWYSPNGGAA